MAVGLPLKTTYADGDVYKASDVNDTNGTINANATPFTAGKNAIINGGFDIWQRGTSVAVATGTYPYTADRWNLYPYSTGNAHTVSRQATGDTTNLPFIQYCGRFQRNAGQTGTSPVYLCNSLETTDSIRFVGRPVTISFYARKGANYSSASSALTYKVYSGTGTDQLSNISYTGATAIINSTATLTTTWQRFTATGTVITSTNELSLELSYTPVGTAGAADYFEITGVQLESGSTATPFSRTGGTIQGELAACQRYYWRTVADSFNTYEEFGTGAFNSTTVGWFYIPFPTTMRGAASSIDFSNISITNYGGTNYPITNVAFRSNRSGIQGAGIFATFASGGTAGQFCFINSNNNAAGYLGFSAEL